MSELKEPLCQELAAWMDTFSITPSSRVSEYLSRIDAEMQRLREHDCLVVDKTVRLEIREERLWNAAVAAMQGELAAQSSEVGLYPCDDVHKALLALRSIQFAEALVAAFEARGTAKGGGDV